MAQIAITSLTLSDLSQTHWVARALFALSLISSLSAVICAATQHIVMAPLLTADRIRAWIRGGSNTTYFDPLTIARALLASVTYGGAITPIIWVVWSETKVFRPCEPGDLDLASLDRQNQVSFDYSLMRQCFTPGVIPVIAMSAPIVLLAASVLSEIIAFGIYFGFTWTRDLDANAGLHDSRNVFIMYIVGLGLCTLVYFGSQLIQDEEQGSEYEIVEKYACQYRENNPELNWQRPESSPPPESPEP